MPNVATLTVRLSANSAKLVAEFNKAQRRAKTFGGRMKSALGTASRAFTRLGGVAAVALTSLAVAGIKAGDNLAKTADKLGIAANELAGLRFAAEQTGAGVKTLDLGLQRMVRRVAEAAKGTGEAQKALKELNLDAKELARQSPDEQFRRIADAFESVGSQSDKVRLGFKLFDSEGVALVNTLKAGREQLDRFTDEAKRFGLALTGRQLENVQKAADAQNRVAKAFAGLGRQLGATFAPAMTAASDATANLVARLTAGIPKLTAFAAGIFGVRRELSLLTATELEAEAENLQRQVAEFVEIRDRAALELRTGPQGPGIKAGEQAIFESANASIATLTERYNEVREALQKLNIEQQKVNTATTTYGSFGGPSAQQLQRLQDVKVRWSEISDELDRYIAKQDRIRSVGQSIFNQTRRPLELFIAKMKEAREALEGGLLPGGQDTFDRYRDSLLNDLVPAIDTVKKKVDQLQFDFASAFEDAIVQGEKFREVLKGILQDLARIAIRKAFTQPLADAFGSIIKPFFGSATDAASDAASDAVTGSVTGAVTSLASGSEKSGIFDAGKLAPAESKLVPQAVSVSVVQNIDARGADEARIVRILPELKQVIQQDTIAELAGLVREGQFATSS